MLATLYQELCWTTELDKMSTNGHMLLLHRWNFGPSYVGLLKQLEDIWLLLDKCSKVEDVKVSLVVYATMEMHKSDQVMRQFGWRQNILPPLQDIEALHKFDLRRETHEN
ncbi:hypothetical protein Godav_011040 [Gossypium davidsonii]|uniref:Uncharacterized protein n=1 Tax=Gossypium davidsonii TaxID=34287 RepID=A0A7J8R8H4_GOSDV|nr:hypothetical protein [Gossypium davidsonii]